MELPDIDRQEVLWKLFYTGTGIVTAVAVRAALRSLWEAVRGEEPPANPATPFTSWGDAVVWSAAVGLGVAAGRLLARRAAAEGWERVTGSPPPGIVDPRRIGHELKERVGV